LLEEFIRRDIIRGVNSFGSGDAKLLLNKDSMNIRHYKVKLKNVSSASNGFGFM